MENDWEILDDYEWVRYWFVWLRIFNNFVNMVIWTFWTISLFYTLWIFFFTREMNFLGYYVFIYSMFLNAFALVYLDDYLYFSAERNREEERRIRIEKMRYNDHLYAVLQRTEKLIDRIKLYPEIKRFVNSSNRKFTTIQIMALLARERNRAVARLLREREAEEQAFIEKELQIEAKARRIIEIEQEMEDADLQMNG